MELKANKRLFLLFCLLSLVFSDNLIPGTTLRFQGDSDKTFNVALPSGNYAQYLNIIFKPDVPSMPNPIVLIGKDDQCNTRLYAGTQNYDPIYIFLKKDQVGTTFYICIENLPKS